MSDEKTTKKATKKKAVKKEAPAKAAKAETEGTKFGDKGWTVQGNAARG